MEPELSETTTTVVTLPSDDLHPNIVQPSIHGAPY